METLETLNQFATEISLLNSVLSTLGWDQETVMPTKGATFRARQQAALAGLVHNKLTSPELADLLDTVELESLDTWQEAGIRELKRARDRAVRVPVGLVRELAETGSLGYQAWVEARERNDYSKFAPWLGKMVRLRRSQAECLSRGEPLYEVLLDEYEPGLKEADLKALFGEVEPRLSALFHRIAEEGETPPPLQGDFPESKQEAFGREVLSAMGFDWGAGRLDRSPHPFCVGLSPGDVRITTRYSRQDPTSSLFGVIHEGGHALYEQGLDADHYGSPACDAVSLGVHESQSRLWENMIGRSPAFWKYWLPRFQSYFSALAKMRLPDFVSRINRVEASLIRVEADEVTYGLHIILRFEIESALLDGALDVDELPDVWNARMKDCLGVTPATDAEGVLQDTHWSQGMIGYFPTYLLGNLYAAQLLHQIKKEIPKLEDLISRGDLLPLREWLRQKVHLPGKTVTGEQLLTTVTGEPLNAAFFLDYLHEKFEKIYSL